MLSNAEKQKRRRDRLRAKLITFPLPKAGCIETDGERIHCHVCGIWLKCLAPSHLVLHSMTADDYREEFGLNRRQPLCAAEHSQWCSEHIGKIGNLHRNTDIEKFQRGREKLRGRKQRLQACIKASQVRKGKPVKLTPARAISQKLNAKKALHTMSCEMCGVTVIRNKSAKHAYCPACLPLHKSQYQRDYNDANAVRLRAYWQKYDQKRRCQRPTS